MTGSETCGQVWLRQPRESIKAFSAFQLYLGLGDKRSLTKTAEHLSVRRQSIQEWSAKYGWPERSRAYDNFLAMEAYDRIARRLAAQADRYSALASAHLEKMTKLEDLNDAALCTKMASDLTRSESVEAKRQELIFAEPQIVKTILFEGPPEGCCWARISKEDADKYGYPAECRFAAGPCEGQVPVHLPLSKVDEFRRLFPTSLALVP